MVNWGSRQWESTPERLATHGTSRPQAAPLGLVENLQRDELTGLWAN